MTTSEPNALDRLRSIILSRATTDPQSSYTSHLLSRGIEKCAQKVGEEAVEVALAAVLGRKDGVIKESADLLYHLSVLWVAADIDPQNVYAELIRREDQTGLSEKASRQRHSI